MTLPGWLRAVLPADTARTWELVRTVLPGGAYLAGGTAIAVHLRHRVSRDLDFFLTEPADLADLASNLCELGTFAATLQHADTFNGQFNGTRLQFLYALDQQVLEPPTRIEGLPIAGLGDLLAMKLKVIGDRGELRDYFDAKTIETHGRRRAEEGLSLFLRRYRPRDPDAALRHVLLGLGYFDHVGEDPSLPEAREVIVDYWRARQPELLRAIGA
ncbi:MAG: nucleotidyl transferase AbiEii/AbiGii toxin family protein [Sporichthyaceae bacterium]